MHDQEELVMADFVESGAEAHMHETYVFAKHLATDGRTLHHGIMSNCHIVPLALLKPFWLVLRVS